MTVSFHKYGNYFPGTGAINETGHGQGLLFISLLRPADDRSPSFYTKIRHHNHNLESTNSMTC